MDSRKQLVRACYDRIAEPFAIESRRRPIDHPRDAAREREWFERFCAMLPPHARVLDLGCGNGEPYLADLVARGDRVVGVDFSRAQLTFARARVPTAALVEADMAELAFSDGAFDGIWSLHAIWNLPRHEHAPLFARARRWLADGGVALLTVAAVPSAEFVDGPGLFTELCGEPTFYDAHRADVPLPLIEAAGFTIESHAFEHVLFVLARAI